MPLIESKKHCVTVLDELLNYRKCKRATKNSCTNTSYGPGTRYYDTVSAPSLTNKQESSKELMHQVDAGKITAVERAVTIVQERLQVLDRIWRLLLLPASAKQAKLRKSWSDSVPKVLEREGKANGIVHNIACR
jgi:hypothetical protein